MPPEARLLTNSVPSWVEERLSGKARSPGRATDSAAKQTVELNETIAASIRSSMCSSLRNALQNIAPSPAEGRIVRAKGISEALNRLVDRLGQLGDQLRA